MKEVKVEILNGLREKEMQEMLTEYLNSGYEIQNSQVEWYCGTVQGVYVFVREKLLISRILIEVENSSRKQVISVLPSDFSREIDSDNPPTHLECEEVIEKEFFLSKSDWKVKGHKLIF